MGRELCGYVFFIRKNENKSLYLSVNVLSTAVQIGVTVNKQTNIVNRTETC